MVVLGIILSVAIIYVCAILLEKGDLYDETGVYVFLMLGCILFVFSSVVACVSGWEVVEGQYIDEKIAMYEEENASIDSNIAEVVVAYLGHENALYEGLSEKINSESAITVVVAYPELNSSEIIAKQIEAYRDNNNKIKELRDKKITLSAYRWWLYFGS